MAEGVFVHLIKGEGFQNEFKVDSAGTAGYHVGERPDSRMLETAQQHGVELPNRARQFVVEDFEAYDYIVAMDDSNMENIVKIKPSNQVRAKLFKMRDFDSIEKGGDVPDPYYGGLKGFENVYQMLLRCNQNFLTYLKSKDE